MYNDVPQYILDHLKGEPVDFVVQSKYNYVKRSRGIIVVVPIIILVLSFSWLIIFPILSLIPLIDLLTTGSTEITINGTLETYTYRNPWVPLLFGLVPMIFAFAFLFPIYLLLRKGLSLLTKRGQWYAGTNDSLIEFDGQSVDYYPWSTIEPSVNTKMHKDGTVDIILTHKKDKQTSRPTTATNIQTNFNIKINGKPVDMEQLELQHRMFRNKIGLLGIKNGNLVLKMIRHNLRLENQNI